MDKDILCCFVACLMDIIWQTQNEITYGALVPNFRLFQVDLTGCSCYLGFPYIKPHPSIFFFGGTTRGLDQGQF